MLNIYQVEFVNNTESNNIETIIKFYVTDDFGRIINNIKNDKSLESFTISNVHNVSNSSEVILL